MVVAGGVLASSAWGPGMLLNPLLCPCRRSRPPSPAENDTAPVSPVPVGGVGVLALNILGLRFFF